MSHRWLDHNQCKIPERATLESTHHSRFLSKQEKTQWCHSEKRCEASYSSASQNVCCSRILTCSIHVNLGHRRVKGFVSTLYLVVVSIVNYGVIVLIGII